MCGKAQRPLATNEFDGVARSKSATGEPSVVHEAAGCQASVKRR